MLRGEVPELDAVLPAPQDGGPAAPRCEPAPTAPDSQDELPEAAKRGPLADPASGDTEARLIAKRARQG